VALPEIERILAQPIDAERVEDCSLLWAALRALAAIDRGGRERAWEVAREALDSFAHAVVQAREDEEDREGLLLGGDEVREFLAGLGPEARALSPCVVSQLERQLDRVRDDSDDSDDDSDGFEVNSILVRSLGEMAPAAPDAAPVVLRAWRAFAASLARVEPEDAPWSGSVSLFTEELGSIETPDPYREHLEALAEVAAESSQRDLALPVFLDVLARRERYEALRPDAARGLGRAGADRARSVPALLEALGDPDHRLREAAATALRSFEPLPPEVAAELLAALDDADPRVRAEAARSLGACSPEAAGAVDGLVRALADSHPGVRERAARALGELGPDAPAAVASLVALVGDPSLLVRRRAVEALGLIGPAAHTAVAALERAREEEALRWHAGTALRRIGR
jgi:HEAT repeat protein